MFTTRLRALSVFVVLAAAGSGLLLAQAPQTVGTWVGVGSADNPFDNGAHVDVGDGHTLIVGGTAPDGAATNVVANLDTATNQFAIAGTLLSARTGHTATLLKDGRVLVTGGTTNSLVSTDIEIFDPSTGSSTLVAQMAEPRRGHVAALLQSGSVLIAGGYTSGDAVLPSAFIFDPATNSVLPTPAGLNVARASASATSLIDGRVVIVGGTDGTNDLASAEIFDPTLQSFTTVSTQLSVPVRGHFAVLLPNNGSVLIAGGTSNGVAQAGADLFLPAEFPDPFSWGVGQFAPTSAMSAARSSAIAGPMATEGYAVATGGGSNDVERYRFATIKTDKDDYAPGQTAIITGSGWQANEEVRLLFQEDPAVHEDYVLTVTADSTGNIYHDQWAPEEHDLGVQFYLMATGEQSGRRAQTTFTDNINVAVDNATFVWHRTGEVPGGFDVSVSGTYTCNTQGSAGNQCTSVTDLTITVSGATGSKVITGLASNVSNASWGPVTLQFRTAPVPGSGQFTIPVDGRQDVTATLRTNATNSPSIGSKNNYFGVDNIAPITSIQCGGAACVNPYNASVQVTLSATDGGGPNVSGVTSTVYCVDTANTCTPTTTYTAAGFTVPFVGGTTSYVRYSSADNAGNIETTKSQPIQFQANTFNVTFNATPLGDVSNITTVLSVTIGANPAVGVTQQDLPKTFTVASGTNVSYSYNSLLGVSATKQYRWLSTGGAGSASGQTGQSGSLSVTQDSLVSATYKAQYLLTLAITAGVPSGLAHINGGANGTFYDDDADLNLTAATQVMDGLDTRWQFANWTGDVASPPNTSNPVLVTMSQARSITVNYVAEHRLTLAITAGVPNGLANISGGTSGTFYASGTTFTLEATTPVAQGATKQWRFASWTGAVTPSPNSTNPLSVTMDQPRLITANYVAQYLLTLAITANVPNGLANITGGTTNTFYDETVTLNLQAATPVADGPGAQWRFDNWTGDLASPPDANISISVTMNQARSIMANYVKQYQLTLAITSGVPGLLTTNVTGGGNGTFYDVGTGLTLEAVTPVPDGAGKQWRFANWTGDVASPPNVANPVAVTMNQPRSITANYIAQYQLTWTQTGLANTGANTVVTITVGSSTVAKPAGSPLFSEWYDQGTTVSYIYSTPISTVPVSNIQYELTNVTGNPSGTPSPVIVSEATTITGNYSPSTYTIQYLQPLDESNGTTYHENTGKNGRVIPVKVLIFENGTAIADTSTVLMRVMAVQCSPSAGVGDLIEEYADAGFSNGNTDLFRWSPPQWIYNLDTKALGLTNNKCYRLDVYVTSVNAIKASAVTWAIFKPVK